MTVTSEVTVMFSKIYIDIGFLILYIEINSLEVLTFISFEGSGNL